MSIESLFGDATPAPATWPSLEPFAPPFTHVLSAPAPAMPAPSAEVTADPYDPTAATRRVTLHLNGTSPQLKLSLPAESLVGWSIATSLAAMVQTARLGDADSVFLSHHARKDLNTTVDLNRRQVESGGYLN